MSGKCDINNNLICAVRDGRLERVRELISAFGLSYSQAWAEGYALLRVALENKRKSVAKLLLTSGAKINSKNKKNRTPKYPLLHCAVKNGDIKIVEMLLDRDVDIDAEDRYGRTPLCIAIKLKKMKIIKLLLNRQACVNNLAITIAIRRGSLKIVKRLLKDCVRLCRTNYTALCLAVEKGNEDIIKLLLNTGANVDNKGEDGETSLHIAVKKGNLNIVKLLLKHETCVNSVHTSTFREGYTPLWFAVEKGHEKIIELLLKYGANVDVQNKHGKTILHLAVEYERSVVIEHILKYCPDVNNESNKSALVTAVHGYKIGQIVNQLLQYGFTLKPEDANDSKLLHAAVQKGYFKIVEQILKYSNAAAISEKGYNTALRVATKHPQEEVAKLLISYAVDVNAQDENENTPIFYATEKGDLKMIELLLANGADVKENRKLLPIAVKTECIEVVELILQHGADVNSIDYSAQYPLTTKYCLGQEFSTFSSDYEDYPEEMPCDGENHDSNGNGMTVLHAATQSGYVKVVEALLEYNADVNVTVTADITPLHISAQEGNEVITKMLLSKGANINAKLKDNRMTPLHMAVHKSHEKVVEVLLRCGAKVDPRMIFDVTPLHLAAQKGYKEIVEALLKFGANIDSTDETGKTALHIASKEGHSGIVEALLIHGADINIESEIYYTPLDYANAGISLFINNHDDGCYYRFRKRGFCRWKPTAEILENHIFKMRTANLCVSKRNLKLIGIYCENPFIIQNECKKEIANMKIEKIDNTNVSFYDILANDANRLAVYLLNENIMQVFRSGGYKIKFPLYASLLESNVTKVTKSNVYIRKSLLEQSNTFFQVVSSNFFELPYDCTEKIFSYLSDEDLRILLAAIRKGEGRKELLEQGYRFFHFLFNDYPEFSYDITEKIFSYLSNQDLRILIQVCKPSCNV